jgi:hypothetical protein
MKQQHSLFVKAWGWVAISLTLWACAVYMLSIILEAMNVATVALPVDNFTLGAIAVGVVITFVGGMAILSKAILCFNKSQFIRDGLDLEFYKHRDNPTVYEALVRHKARQQRQPV